MIYLYLFGTCFHFIYVFMIIGNEVLYAAAKGGLVASIQMKAGHCLVPA